MKDKALVVVVAIIFLAAGFVAGLAVGRQQGPRLSPTERWAQKILKDSEHANPNGAKQTSEVDALKKAFKKKLEKDLQRISAGDHGHGH